MKINTFKISIFLTAGLMLSLLEKGSTHAAPGDLDQAFGNGGKLVTPVAGWLVANRTLLQPDGKFLTIGYDDGPSERFSLRHSTNGMIDNTFVIGTFPIGVDFSDIASLKTVPVSRQSFAFSRMAKI